MIKVASLTLAAALGVAALAHSGPAAADGYVSVGVGVPRVVVAPPVVAYAPYGIVGAPYGAPYYRGYGWWGHRHAYRPGWGYAHGWHRGFRR